MQRTTTAIFFRQPPLIPGSLLFRRPGLLLLGHLGELLASGRSYKKSYGLHPHHNQVLLPLEGPKVTLYEAVKAM
jgi:hypothetical protein